MPHFLVTWSIDIECLTPTKAAQLALEMMRDPHSTATVFEVLDKGDPFNPYFIDLLDEETASCESTDSSTTTPATA
jgi:hypothetical protein